MNAELIYGILFLAVVIVIIGTGGIYMWLTREKPVKKKPPPAPAPTLTPEPGEHKPGNVYIPPEVPRTVGTIKQMVKEDPKLIENVLREWIKGEIVHDVKSTEKEKKKRQNHPAGGGA